MKEFLKLRKDRKKMIKLSFEIKQTDLSQFIGKRVKITKTYADWINNFGEEIGKPYKEIDYIKSKPKGKITDARYDGFLDGFVFSIELDNGQKERVGIEDINIIED